MQNILFNSSLRGGTTKQSHVMNVIDIMQSPASSFFNNVALAPFIRSTTIPNTPVNPATYSDVVVNGANISTPVIARSIGTKQSQDISVFTTHVFVRLLRSARNDGAYNILIMKTNASINPITHLPAKGSASLSIDDFTPTTHLIQVQWYQPGMATNHTAELCRSCFEQWLEDTGRLDYYTEPEEDNYRNLPASGTNDTESYWQYADYHTQTADIKAFILAEIKAQNELS